MQSRLPCRSGARGETPRAGQVERPLSLYQTLYPIHHSHAGRDGMTATARTREMSYFIETPTAMMRPSARGVNPTTFLLTPVKE